MDRTNLGDQLWSSKLKKTTTSVSSPHPSTHTAPMPPLRVRILSIERATSLVLNVLKLILPLPSHSTTSISEGPEGDAKSVAFIVLVGWVVVLGSWGD